MNELTERLQDMLTVFIVDDDASVRDSLALLLGPLTDYQAALDRLLPSVFGLSGFYIVMFIILAAVSLFSPVIKTVIASKKAKKQAAAAAVNDSESAS